eukprot:Lankesteria_metandrocarpae@DN842_c0_g1_i1.p1
MSLPANVRNMLMGAHGGGGPEQGDDVMVADTAEQVNVSALALLKMLKHGRAGVPMEVMGLMLGEFVDEYTIRVVDCFSMPQSGNTVSVEAVDEAYQALMLDMLKRTGRPEMVVGWYHSHPGFGCWFSGTDVNTQQSFEQLNSRAVGVVVDPVQSVRGKVVMDCFRLIDPHLILRGKEPRQTTSNIGHLQKPTISALVHGLNRHYYSIVINCPKNEFEQRMLLNVHRSNWSDPLKLKRFDEHNKSTETLMDGLKGLTEKYIKELDDEVRLTPEQLSVFKVGKIDAKKRLENDVEQMMRQCIVQTLGSLVSTVVF